MLKLVPLEIGRLEANLVAITGEEGSIVLPVPALLIEHPEGLTARLAKHGIRASDVDRQRESMRELTTMRDDGCRLLFGHDPAQFVALPADWLT